jgi:hypothetical protein
MLVISLWEKVKEYIPCPLSFCECLLQKLETANKSGHAFPGHIDYANEVEEKNCKSNLELQQLT